MDAPFSGRARERRPLGRLLRAAAAAALPGGAARAGARRHNAGRHRADRRQATAHHYRLGPGTHICCTRPTGARR